MNVELFQCCKCHSLGVRSEVLFTKEGVVCCDCDKLVEFNGAMVRLEDAELLMCARAQGSVEGQVYATIKIIAHSRQMMNELIYRTFELPKLIGWEQCIADQKGLGINGRWKQ